MKKIVLSLFLILWGTSILSGCTKSETTRKYSDTITLPDGGNYISIKCEDFTGSIELNIE